MANQKTTFSVIKDHLRLLIDSPKDYLYSYTISNKDKISIIEFDPKSKKLGDDLVSQLASVCPNLPTYFIGSANLGIAGKQDIDIYIGCSTSDFKHYIKLLEQVLGTNYKQRAEFIEWHFVKEGFNIDVVLIDPDNKRLKEQLRLFDILKNNSTYLKEYENIKLTANGFSSREYTRRRMQFFNRILK